MNDFERFLAGEGVRLQPTALTEDQLTHFKWLRKLGLLEWENSLHVWEPARVSHKHIGDGPAGECKYRVKQ